MGNLIVKASKFPLIVTALLGIFFVLGGFGMIVNGLLGRFQIVPIALGALLILMFGLVFMLFNRGKGRSVREFTDSGLTRNDGTTLAWSDLARVVDKMTVLSNGRPGLWRTEVQFGSGSAWLIPSKVANWSEVRSYVDQLSCPHDQENA
jgi:hypothetical protein